MIQQRIYTAPKTDAISPFGVVDKPSVVGALYFNIMKEIKLKQGFFALVDDEDYDELVKHKWWVSKNDRNFYAVRHNPKNTNPTTIRMHRQILNISDKFIQIDHKDNNGLNNQKSNLRICSTGENRLNGRSRQGSRSKYVGISYYTLKHKKNGGWVARITLSKVIHYLGMYKTEYEAVIARDKYIIDNNLEFPKLNILTR